MRAALLIISLVACTAFGWGKKSPNIVVILADDYGYGSSNIYGASEEHIRTPNINQLAHEGIQFMDASTPASVCTPTRYAMLTGRYAWRGKIKYGVLNPPEGPLVVEDELYTMPEFLQDNGYRTAHIGKWHLGYTTLPEVEDLSAQPLSPGPRSMGFNYHFAVPNQIDWLPKIYVENESIWGLRSKGKNPYGKSYYKGRSYHGYDAPQRVTTEVTEDLSQHAVRWIRESLREHPDNPFFLYFAPVAVHHPIAPSERFRGTSTIGPYGDFIHDLDYSVGEVMDALAYAGVTDETLIIFTSDNGGDVSMEEDQGRQKGFLVNGELRGDKHLIWQGGLKVPFVARWPGVIEPGTKTDRMINIVDLFATFQELVTGQVAPAEQYAPDSFSFFGELAGVNPVSEVRSSMILNDVRGTHAIRGGAWKYIESKPKRPIDLAQMKKNPNKFQPMLFNLNEDPCEENDVIAEFPEIAEKMQRKLDQIRDAGSERLVSKM